MLNIKNLKMKTIVYLFVAVLLISLTACEEKIEDFKNVVEVTPEMAKKWNLQDVHFKISYPDDDNLIVTKAEEGQSNLSYIMFDYTNEEGLSYEEISIGYCSNCVDYPEDELKNLIGQLSDQFSSQLPNYEEIELGKEKIWGKDRIAVKFKFGSDETMYDFFEAGEYLGMITYITEGSATNNGVMLIMLGNESSGIKDFSDFGEKGKLAEIFKTFRFVE